MWLEFTALTGDIAEFSGLANLTHLSLYKNEAITGDLGDSWSLPNLEVLRLENNYGLVGDVSGWPVRLPSLQVLHVRLLDAQDEMPKAIGDHRPALNDGFLLIACPNGSLTLNTVMLFKCHYKVSHTSLLVN